MKIIYCKPNHLDLAVHAMKAIKCTADDLPPEAATPSAMQTFLENPQNILLLAVKEETVMGYLFAYELQRPDREQAMMFLYDITVEERFRKKGVGTALIEQLRSLCATKSIMKLFVPTNRSNVAAMRLYQKNGAMASTETDEVFLTWNF